MATRNMFGVVLWSDAQAHKAVIWCEDQGDLAFYTPGGTSGHDAPSLDAGDLIQFDMKLEKNLRKVHNPQLLEQARSNVLAESLTQKDTNPGAEDTGQVVSFAKFAKANLSSHPLAQVV